jgi:glycylpeptide N-tetradecanoyltransferase
MKYYIPVLIVI